MNTDFNTYSDNDCLQIYINVLLQLPSYPIYYFDGNIIQSVVKSFSYLN